MSVDRLKSVVDLDARCNLFLKGSYLHEVEASWTQSKALNRPFGVVLLTVPTVLQLLRSPTLHPAVGVERLVRSVTLWFCLALSTESFAYLPHSALALTESAFGLLPNRRFAVDQKVDAVSSLFFVLAGITT